MVLKCYTKSLFFLALCVALFFGANKAFCGTIDGINFTSAIVVNAKNGKIIYSNNIDERIYPASMTKIMTAYLVFEAIDKGVIGMYDKIDEKKYIDYGIYGGKMFKYGTKNITIQDLLMKLIVLSANPAADILAMEVSGNVKKFVGEMNKKAKEFKMLRTNFENPHGLYDAEQQSTVRDVANMSIHMVNDYPKMAKMFGITDYVGKSNAVEEKTTTIQRSIKGLQGSKTGHINASGYNIAVWGKYGNDEIFAVLVGANSKAERDKLALKLINIGVKNNFSGKNNNDVFDNNLVAKAIKFVGLDPNKYISQKPVVRNIKENINDEDDESSGRKNRFIANDKSEEGAKENNMEISMTDEDGKNNDNQEFSAGITPSKNGDDEDFEPIITNQTIMQNKVKTNQNNVKKYKSSKRKSKKKKNGKNYKIEVKDNNGKNKVSTNSRFYR